MQWALPHEPRDGRQQRSLPNAQMASNHTARVPLRPGNFTIANLILCQRVASASGAHFVPKMTLFTLYLTGGLFLNWRESSGPRKGVTHLSLFQRYTVRPGQKCCPVCPFRYPFTSCPNHSLPGVLTQESRLSLSLIFLLGET